MIIINNRCDTIALPITNRCYWSGDKENYYLLIQNTFTKDIYILKMYNPFNGSEFLYCITLSLPDCFSKGEYEYYFTPDNLLKVILDINNITNIENQAFKNNELNVVFSKNGIIFAESGDSIISNTECQGKIFDDMRIISHGILKFNEGASYYERDKETGSKYVERSQ